MSPVERPLSPHVSVYRWQISMTMSILHRITGVGLGLGTLLLTWWLIAAAAGPAAYGVVHDFLGSIIGRVILLGFTLALFYHLCNGIRHLVWDAGYGYDVKTMTRSGLLAFTAAIVLTVIAWLLAYAWRS